jgi:hypothetical protein
MLNDLQSAIDQFDGIASVMQEQGAAVGSA